MPLRDLRAVTRLLGQLERRLEEIHEQPQRAIQLLQRRSGLQPLIAPVAHRVTDHCTVLLFDPRLVVLAVRPAAGELHPGRRAIVPHRLVHEHAIIVSVSNPSSGNGNSLRNSPSTAVSSFCSRTSTGAHSVQPVAMSVSVSVYT